MRAQRDLQREGRADALEVLADRFDDMAPLGRVGELRRLAAQADEVRFALEEAESLRWALDELPDAEDALGGLQAHEDTLRALVELDHVAEQAVELTRALRRVRGLGEDLRFAAEEARSEENAS